MSSFKRAAGVVVSRQRIQVPTISSIQIQNRTFASDSKNDDSKKLPFGIEKILGEPDNLIPTDLESIIDPGHIPVYEKGLLRPQTWGTMNNELGLVLPPEGAGSFNFPILIPSRMDCSRVVGYEDPSTHAMFWFTNSHNDENNSMYYVGLIFRMLHIPDENAAAHAH